MATIKTLKMTTGLSKRGLLHAVFFVAPIFALFLPRLFWLRALFEASSALIVVLTAVFFALTAITMSFLKMSIEETSRLLTSFSIISLCISYILITLTLVLAPNIWLALAAVAFLMLYAFLSSAALLNIPSLASALLFGIGFLIILGNGI